MNRFVTALALTAGLSANLHAADGIRVATWNISFYAGDRAEQIGTVVYAQWNNRSLDPDVICLQEMTGRVPTLALVAALNDAPDSPGDWAAAPIFTNPGGVLHTALVYRTSKLEFVQADLVAAGGPAPQQPRNVVRFDLRAVGYDEDDSLLSFFPLHYKAGYTDSDLARKLVEAQIVHDHIDTLPENRHIILGADLNIQRSTDHAYQALNGITPNTGVLWDPISTPGNWNNNAAFRNIHTQDPTGGGGMDDRLDQILLSPSLLDGSGFDYDGDFSTPWNLATTQDPNHSHRAWGNDGSSYNQNLRISGNTMVGPEIAQAIADMAIPDGHIPVYLDLDVPPRVRLVGEQHELGTIHHGDTREILVRVGNNADTDLWGVNGIAPLVYRFQTDSPIVIPTDEFQANPGTQLSSHIFELDTNAYTQPGNYSESVTLHSDDPGSPQIILEVHFQLVGCNAADLAAPLSQLTFIDVSTFISAFNAQDPIADLAAPYGTFDFFDISHFLTAYTQGCDD